MRTPISPLSIRLFVALTAVAMSASAADWPSWRGPAQNGSSPEIGLVTSWSPKGENLLWRAAFSGRSTPVVVGDRVCATGRAGEGKTRQEMVACFDVASGKQLWERRFDVYNTTVPWNRVGWASPAADPETGYVYVQAVHGTLTCLDAAGEVVWSHNLHERFGMFTGYGGRTHTPTVFEDLLITHLISTSWGKFGPPRDRVFAFDKRTGDVIWISTPGGPDHDKNTYSNPVFAEVGGRDLMISGNADGSIYALEPRTGRKVWGFNLSKRGINATVVVNDGVVFISHSEENLDAGSLGRVVAIDATGSGDVTTTHELWRIDELTAGYASAAYAAGRLWLVDNSANLHSVDPKTGVIGYHINFGTVGKGSPVWADGHIYQTEVNGRFSIIKVGAEGAKIVDQDDLEVSDGRYAEIYGSAAIADGRIFFTSEEGLYAIGRKDAKPQRAQTAKAPAAAKRAVASAKPATVVVSPADVLVAPGEKVTFTARVFDAAGVLIGERQADWSAGKLAGVISSEGQLQVSSERAFQVGEIEATVGELHGTARVRAIGAYPWRDDFESYEVGSSVPHWLFSSRFKIGEDDGQKVLTKPPVASGLQRTTAYLGSPLSSGYTMQIDVLGRQEGRRLPDMGLVNAGYTLDLMGNHQRLQVRSWGAALRMAEHVPFSWDADTWYTMKLRVDAVGDDVTIHGKVWPRATDEPEAWTIRVTDALGIESGAPGIYGYSPVEILYDNLVVTESEALDGGAAKVATSRPADAKSDKTTAAKAATRPSGSSTHKTVDSEPAKVAAAMSVKGEAPAMFGGTPGRNMVSSETGLPATWDIGSGKNVLWSNELGSQSYGGPVVYGGKLFMGTNNEAKRSPKYEGDKGVMMAFDATSGEFLWQIVHDKLTAGRVNDWPLQGVCSSPYVVGDRLYYVSNRAEIVCADTEGFRDGENDGPFKGETDTDEIAGDIVWSYDMIGELDVFPHNLAVSSPVMVDGILFIVTGNGVDEGHVNVPAPRAPSFIALDGATGKLLWENSEPGEAILHGSWSNAAYGVIDGVPQAVFPGGDGWLYSFAPRTGELLWKFDCNPKDSVWELGGSGSRNNLISSPVIHEGRVYTAVGQDPEHGEGRGHLYAIDGSKRGDITSSGLIWHRGGDDFNRTISTAAIVGDLMYDADLSGYLYVLDLATGKERARYNAYAAVWSSPFVADGRVYLTDEDGDVAVFEAGSELKLLEEINMGRAVYTTPVARDGVLFIATRNRVYALKDGIAAKE